LIWWTLTAKAMIEAVQPTVQDSKMIVAAMIAVVATP
jgi:hypothetical protein